MDRWKPIRKVAVGFVAAGIAYAAKQFGVDLGPAEVNQAALAFVGVVAAYLVKS